MMRAEDVDSKRNKVQSQVVQVLNKTNYSLNIVNRYKENIVHVSAANNCIEILKCILQKHDKHCLERKNAFGWTPLMQAIRNENIEMVKFLLDTGVTVNDFSFLGMSVLTLACAISMEMFDIIYNRCPSALEYAARDDIDPLCVAALKNDKELFFKLINLGLNISKANAFTHIMMRQSTVLEISALAKSHCIVKDYWNDISDIEDLLKEQEINNTINNSGTVINNNNNKAKSNICIPKLNLINSMEFQESSSKKRFSSDFQSTKVNNQASIKNSVSPTLSYLSQKILPVSPNTFITEENSLNICRKFALDMNKNLINNTKNNELSILETENYISISPLVLRRCQSKRPPNLNLRSSSNDSNTTLSFTPQFSPTKSPNLPSDMNEDNIFDDTTPTPPRYERPPRGIMFDPSTTKLMILLQRFGLERHIPIFLEQEVDLDLFLSLTDKDLIEIGINSKFERLILLSVISECKGSKMNFFIQ